MLVRGASDTPDTPEGTPTVSTPPSSSRKRRHSVMVRMDDVDPGAQHTDSSNIVLAPGARDTTRPRLTISRHPVFLPSTENSPFHMTDLCAVNRQLDKVGFKYTPAGLAEPGAAIPYRTIESKPTCTRISWEDRSPLVRVTQDGLGLIGDKGFRSARTNVGVQEGKWYMEVKIEKGGSDEVDTTGHVGRAHVRLGWGRREAPLNGPVGLDGYSYGFRDKTGEKVTLSRPRPYGKPFRTGDVVGLYISLPPRRKPNPKDAEDPAHIRRERIPIDFKGQEYFESLDYPQSKEMLALVEHPSKAAKAEAPHQTKKSATVKNLPGDRIRAKPTISKMAPHRALPTLPGSKIAFFVNGECQGIAYQDVYDYLQLRPTHASRRGRDKQRRNKEGPMEHTENHFDDGTLGYYPFFSLFGAAQVYLNPGPDFMFPPPSDIDAILSSEPSSAEQRTWRPMSERYPEFMAQQWALDAEEEAEYKAYKEKQEVDDVLEEKKRLQREKRRIADAARRKKKADEKKAAAAAAAAVVSPSMPLPDASTVTYAMPSPAPSLAASIAPSPAVDAEIENTPASSPTKDQQNDYDVTITDMPDDVVLQMSPSNEFGDPTQPEDWVSEDEESAQVAQDIEPEEEMDNDGDDDESHPPEEVVPAWGFQESSTRWSDQ